VSNNQVTIKLDARFFYGLVALLAVVGIFGIGLWIGGFFGTTSAPQTTTAPAAAPAGDLTLGQPPASGVQAVTAPPPGQAAAAAQKPVSVADVPVGDAEPRLWIPEAAEVNFTVDLGEIPADKATERDFTIENAGTSELVIEDTSASCGCTAAHIGESNLAPGAKTTLRVSYDPRVNQEFGKFIQKQVRVKSNDPLVPLAEFTITADVASQ